METQPEEAIVRYLREIGAKGGNKAAQKLTKEQRVERARRAVAAREAKKRGQSDGNKEA